MKIPSTARKPPKTTKKTIFARRVQTFSYSGDKELKRVGIKQAENMLYMACIIVLKISTFKYRYLGMTYPKSNIV